MPESFFQSPVPSPSVPIPLIDVHVHLGPSNTDSVTYPTLAGEEYAAAMQDGTIAAACAFPPLRTDGYGDANRRLAEWAEASDAQIMPFARLGGRTIPVREPHLWLLKHALHRYRCPLDPSPELLHELDRFAGVKLLPVMDGLPSDDAFARIRELRLPVLVHGGQYVPPRWIEQSILPKTRGPLIIAHLGAYPNHESLLHDAVDLARRRDRVYLDTSGAWLAAFLKYAVERVPDKLLFGSDAPLAHPLVAWQHLASVVRDEQVLRAISHDTAARLFDLSA